MQTHADTHRHTHTHTNRQTDRHTHTHTHTHTCPEIPQLCGNRILPTFSNGQLPITAQLSRTQILARSSALPGLGGVTGMELEGLEEVEIGRMARVGVGGCG